MLAPYEQHARSKLITLVVSILVIAGVVVWADHVKAHNSALGLTRKQNTISEPASNNNLTTTTSSPPTSPSSGASSFKDGTYSASSNYYVPNGYESIDVSLTLQNGVITGASVKNSESNNVSASFQQDFASEYKSYVVGKKLSDLQLSVIAGASDTTMAFSSALNQIGTKAQA